jgi:hypothetical protein
MKKLTYETFLADPRAVQDQIEFEARRMRSAALKAMFFDPLAAFCGRLLAIRGARLLIDPRRPVAQ